MPKFRFGVTRNYYQNGKLTIEAATAEEAESKFESQMLCDSSKLAREAEWDDMVYEECSFGLDGEGPDEVEDDETEDPEEKIESPSSLKFLEGDDTEIELGTFIDGIGIAYRTKTDRRWRSWSRTRFDNVFDAEVYLKQCASEWRWKEVTPE